MSTAPVPYTPAPRARDDHDVRLAWACLVAAPFVGVLVFVVGDVVASALGYDGVGVAPWWIALTVLAVTAAMLAVPALLAVRFAARAHAAGDDRGRVPAVIVVVGALGFVGLNLVSWVAMTLAG